MNWERIRYSLTNSLRINFILLLLNEVIHAKEHSFSYMNIRDKTTKNEIFVSHEWYRIRTRWQNWFSVTVWLIILFSLLIEVILFDKMLRNNTQSWIPLLIFIFLSCVLFFIALCVVLSLIPLYINNRSVAKSSTSYLG